MAVFLVFFVTGVLLLLAPMAVLWTVVGRLGEVTERLESVLEGVELGRYGEGSDG